MPSSYGRPEGTRFGRRVALDPMMAERFAKLGVDMLIEKGAGASAFSPTMRMPRDAGW